MSTSLITLCRNKHQPILAQGILIKVRDDNKLASLVVCNPADNDSVQRQDYSVQG
jgi:hypothetical protein